MSKSVVPAAAVARAKHLVNNKKLTKHPEAQQPAQDEGQTVPEHKDENAQAVKTADVREHQVSMSEAPLGTFSFSGALSEAAGSAASLTSSSMVQDDSGSMGEERDGSGMVLGVAAGGLAILGGVVALSGGGGHKNHAPEITSAATATIAENAATSTVVYTAAASDADGDTLTYTLGGTDAAAFNINASTGAVTFKASPDFETKASYTFTVTASDGELSSAAKTVTVSVTDVNESPVFTSGATASIAENAAATTVVYDAAATGASSFALSGADAGAFNFDTTTGVLTLKNSADFETKGTYNVTVTATNASGSTAQNLVVTVTNVNEAPHITVGDDTLATDSGTPVNGTFTVSDPDAGDTLTTTVVDTEVHGTITLGNGTFTYTPNAGFEGTDTFQIKVTDAAGLSDTHTVSVDVGPQVNEVSLDVGSQSTQVTVNLDDGANVLTEDDSVPTNVIVFNFTDDDVIQSTGNPNDYSFARQGNNLEIQNNNGGSVTTIIIAGVADHGFVFDLNSAIAVVGHDFITFG